MSAYRKSLPPLDTLVFFEAAMRHSSFTGAAEELFVTQAAVSKRIRQLEVWLGTDLFDRSGRRLAPTAAGTYLADKAGMTLDFLEQALAALKVPERPSLRLASVTALSTFWLQPRLKDFALSDMACQFTLTTADDLSELLNPEHDLVLLHGDGRWPGWRAEPLFPEVVVPVGTAEVVETVITGSAGSLPPLLQYPRVAPNWIDWPGWIKRTGRATYRDHPIAPCASYNQSIGRALKGQGLALGTLPLLGAEIASGALVALPGGAFATGSSYFIACPATRPLGPDAERLRSVLLTAV